MKKIISFLSLAITFIMIPATAFAASAVVVSGPSGAQVNGWYSEPPTMVVNSIPSCPTGPGTITLYGGGGEGQHHITLINLIADNYNGAGPKVLVFDKPVPGDLGYEPDAWTCTALGMMGGGQTPRENIWVGDIKWDRTAPTISISTPSNNSNIDSSTVQVSGPVADNASGVWKVIVGGVTASLSGGSFSASVPVNYGLNTLTATVYDYAGHTSQAQVIVNRISSCGGTCSATGGNSASSSGSSNSSSTPQSNNSPAATQQQSAENKTADVVAVKSEDNKDSTPTMVKGVVQNGGIGLATIFAFLFILLLLDKFRIIEIKAFSNITKKINKKKANTAASIKKPKA